MFPICGIPKYLQGQFFFSCINNEMQICYSFSFSFLVKGQKLPR